jgi:hypothetical protein
MRARKAINPSKICDAWKKRLHLLEPEEKEIMDKYVDLKLQENETRLLSWVQNLLGLVRKAVKNGCVSIKKGLCFYQHPLVMLSFVAVKVAKAFSAGGKRRYNCFHRLSNQLRGFLNCQAYFNWYLPPGSSTLLLLLLVSGA